MENRFPYTVGYKKPCDLTYSYERFNTLEEAQKFFNLQKMLGYETVYA